jgi:hypothetical protein
VGRSHKIEEELEYLMMVARGQREWGRKRAKGKWWYKRVHFSKRAARVIWGGKDGQRSGMSQIEGEARWQARRGKEGWDSASQTSSRWEDRTIKKPKRKQQQAERYDTATGWRGLMNGNVLH